ncbi:MAG: hypothetical protein ABI231_08035 [Candidatus Tumulicola sp.]
MPQHYVEGWAYGAGGSLIVGTLITNDGGYFGFDHAALWQGSSHTFTDLNPAGFAFSEAYAVRGTAQAGYAFSSTTNSYHAVLWHGTATSAVDLTPSTVSNAYATGLGQRSEVGSGRPTGMSVNHALLWHGTAASMVDLHPASFTDSCARAALGNVQVGYGHISANALHALLWKGSAKTAVDLQQYLPNTFTSSEAYAIDTSGAILGSAYSTSTVTWHAVVWVP